MMSLAQRREFRGWDLERDCWRALRAFLARALEGPLVLMGVSESEEMSVSGVRVGADVWNSSMSGRRLDSLVWEVIGGAMDAKVK